MGIARIPTRHQLVLERLRQQAPMLAAAPLGARDFTPASGPPTTATQSPISDLDLTP
jgi:hypothetical protein